MAHPSTYKTLQGLLRATERALEGRHAGKHRLDGQSIAMWLRNAEYCAERFFKSGIRVRELLAKWSVTRPQDLRALDGGHAVFGVPLPARAYGIGDKVPGVGPVEDATEAPMAISMCDRIAALEIACQAEREAVERAERSDNCVAVAINRQRLEAAERRLSAAVAATSI